MDEKVRGFIETARRAVAGLDMEQRELASGLGVTPQHLNAVLNGRANLSRRLEEGLCRELGIAPSGWWAAAGTPSSEGSDKTAGAGGGLRGEGTYVALPLRGGLQSYVALRQDWLACKTMGPGSRAGRSRLFLVRMEGDALRPEIVDGALVLVDGAQCEPAHGRIFYVRLGTGFSFRRLHVEPGVCAVVSGEKGEIHTPVDGGLVEIVGRALWCCVDL